MEKVCWGTNVWAPFEWPPGSWFHTKLHPQHSFLPVLVYLPLYLCFTVAQSPVSPSFPPFLFPLCLLFSLHLCLCLYHVELNYVFFFLISFLHFLPITNFQCWLPLKSVFPNCSFTLRFLTVFLYSSVSPIFFSF